MFHDEQDRDSSPLSPSEIAAQFVLTYFRHLHREPETIHQFYSDDSSFARIEATEPLSDASTITGQQNIQKKVQGYQNCKVAIATIDAQSTNDGGILILVTGILLRQGETPQDFVQSFFLQKDPSQRRYYVANDILRFRELLNEEISVESLQSQPAQQEVQQEDAPVESGQQEQVGNGDLEEVAEEVEEPAEAVDGADAEPIEQSNEVAEELAQEPEPRLPEPVVEVAQAPVKQAVAKVAAAPAPIPSVAKPAPEVPAAQAEPPKPNSWAALFHKSAPIQFLPEVQTKAPAVVAPAVVPTGPQRTADGKRLRPGAAAPVVAAPAPVAAAAAAPVPQSTDNQTPAQRSTTAKAQSAPSRPRPQKGSTKNDAPNTTKQDGEGEFLLVQRKSRPAQKEKAAAPAKESKPKGGSTQKGQSKSKNLLAGAN